MQITRYFCDICEKECLVKDGLGTFAGFTVKMNEKLEAQRIGFEGHYCNECLEKMLEFTNSLKEKNAKHPDSGEVSK